jgi:hypothetical protein
MSTFKDDLMIELQELLTEYKEASKREKLNNNAQGAVQMIHLIMLWVKEYKEK